MKSITVRLPDKVGANLELVASGLDRSKSYVAVQAIQEFVAREAAFIAAVQEGIAAAERGDFATDEEVEAVFAEFANIATAETAEK